MQTTFFGVGAKSFAPPEASFVHARAGRGTVPLAGAQRSVQVTLLAGAAEFAQNVTRNAVVPAAVELEGATKPTIRSASTDTRM